MFYKGPATAHREPVQHQKTLLICSRQRRDEFCHLVSSKTMRTGRQVALMKPWLPEGRRLTVRGHVNTYESRRRRLTSDTLFLSFFVAPPLRPLPLRSERSATFHYEGKKQAPGIQREGFNMVTGQQPCGRYANKFGIFGCQPQTNILLSALNPLSPD